MRKDLLCKTLVIGVIVLFIGVGIQPAFAVESKSSADTTENEEDCDCQFVSDINLSRPLCVITALTTLYIISFIILFDDLADESGEGTIMYYFYSGIAKIFVNRYYRWVGIYEDVLECGDWILDSELENELGKEPVRELFPDFLAK